MKNNEIYQILRIIIIIIISVLLIKVFIWALPLLFLVIIGYLIYTKLFKNNKPKVKKETKRKTINKVVHEAEIVSEKND